MIPRKRDLTIVIPALGGVVFVGGLIATMLAFAAILGGAEAQTGCSTTGTPPASVPGAPESLRPIFTTASERYRLGTQGPSILAGLTSVESGFGKNMGPSSAGAIGWTQFMPETWRTYGVDANHDGTADPYDAADAIFSSARYLQANGAPADWYGALFAYNHADWYVSEVLARAKELSANTALRSAPAAAAAAAGGALIVVGDSLEVGTFPILRRLLGGELVGDMKSGRSSTAGVAALRRLVSSTSYGAVLFDLGTNDSSVAELRASLRQLLRLVAAQPIYLATVNSPFDEQAKNTAIARFARKHANVSVIPWHRASSDLALADGVHGAYDSRARLIARWIDQQDNPAPDCPPSQVLSAPVHRVTGTSGLVPVPGQPGQEVDRRILSDVQYLLRTYRVSITAAYAPTGHAAGGEHPLGLALDIVPAPGGSWEDVDRLAHWAEPTQNAPRPPFRWVGYDGDPNHGRGNHLHLSWNHAPVPDRRPPAEWVDTFELST